MDLIYPLPSGGDEPPSYECVTCEDTQRVKVIGCNDTGAQVPYWIDEQGVYVIYMECPDCGVDNNE